MTNRHDGGHQSQFAMPRRIRSPRALQDSNACNRLFRLRIPWTGRDVRRATHLASPSRPYRSKADFLLRRKLTPVVIQR